MKTKNTFPPIKKPRRTGPSFAYGGEMTGVAKAARPVDVKRPLQLVMRSSQARGKLKLSLHKKLIEKVLKEKAKAYNVDLKDFEIRDSDVQMLVTFKKVKELQTFLRVITGLTARYIPDTQKGRGTGLRFWDHITYSRIINFDGEPQLARATKDYDLGLREAKKTGRRLAGWMNDFIDPAGAAKK